MNPKQKIEILQKQIAILEQSRKNIESQIESKRREIQSIQTDEIGRLYGRCIKEVNYQHQSDNYNTSDSSTIKVGDVICFSNHPNYKDATFSAGWGPSYEWFDVEPDSEHFEFFETIEDVETVDEYNGFVNNWRKIK